MTWRTGIVLKTFGNNSNKTDFGGPVQFTSGFCVTSQTSSVDDHDTVYAEIRPVSITPLCELTYLTTFQRYFSRETNTSTHKHVFPNGKGKVKVNCPCAVTEHNAIKAYWGCGGIAPLIL
jgi:hypothetical protein